MLQAVNDGFEQIDIYIYIGGIKWSARIKATQTAALASGSAFTVFYTGLYRLSIVQDNAVGIGCHGTMAPPIQLCSFWCFCVLDGALVSLRALGTPCTHTKHPNIYRTYSLLVVNIVAFHGLQDFSHFLYLSTQLLHEKFCILLNVMSESILI